MKVDSAANLDRVLYRESVRQALVEDSSWSDLTTAATVADGVRAIGEILAKSVCVLAGVQVALECFKQVDPDLEVIDLRSDGDECAVGDSILKISGHASALLMGERTALNFLQRMSGIATLTHQFVELAGDRAVILDTRKTTPMLRVLEKYAVRVGGGVNHRMSLNDGILIKDNHIRMAGSISNAVFRVKRADHDYPVEVEAQTLADVEEAVECGVDIVLADNMSVREIREAVRLTRGLTKLEVSGGINLEILEDVVEAGPDRISVGALTHSAPSVDFSFDLRPEESILADGSPLSSPSS